MLLASQGRAQSIPSAWKTAADCEQYRQGITTAVKTKIAKLLSDDTETQKYVRNWFIEQVTATQPPSASFMDIYADVLNNALENLVDPKNAPGGKPVSIRVRLNAAIINQAIAQRAGNARQSTVTFTLMHDPCAAVVLWGVKAARYELAAQLGQVLRDPDLIEAIVDAVKAHPDSGAIADEAFLAFTLDPTDRDLKYTSDAALKELISKIIELLTFRLTLFADTSPSDLYAESHAVTFLSRQKIHDLETPDQQLKVKNLLYDYLAACSKLLVGPDAPNKTELLDLIHQIGRALFVIAQHESNAALKDASEPITGISPDSKPGELEQRLSAVRAAIH